MPDAAHMPIEWQQDCMRERGRVLTGRYWHWCPDWDGLPIDETVGEWPCACAGDLIRKYGAEARG